MQIRRLKINDNKCLVDFEINLVTNDGGSSTILIGENGTGKSTIFKALLGLILRENGTIQIMGKDIDELSAEDKQKIGVVLNDSGFSGYLTIKDIVPILTHMYPLFEKEIFLQQCNSFGLPINKKIKDFYTGMKTKLKILHEMNLEIYQKLCAESKILWTQHCLQRMQERDISRADVKNGIATGEIIEDYPDDFPNPSCLIFGYNVNGRILHIVAGCDNINIYIITAYYPDTKKFEDDLKTRRKR